MIIKPHLLILILIISCAPMQGQKSTKIRVVDEFGNEVKVRRQVPKLNQQLLEQRASGANVLDDKKDAEMTFLDEDNPISKAKPRPKAKSKEEPKVGEVLKKRDPKYRSEKKQASKKRNFGQKKEKKTIISSKYSEKTEKKVFLQVGAFRGKSGAINLLEDHRRFSPGIVEAKRVGSNRVYKVLLGPFSDKKEANIVKEKLFEAGYKDAFIVNSGK